MGGATNGLARQPNFKHPRGAPLTVEKKTDPPARDQATVADRSALPALAALAAGIQTCLQLHQQLGIDGYPLTPGLRQWLHRRPEPLAGRRQTPPPTPSPQPARTEKTPSAEPPPTAGQWAALQEEIRSCRLCALALEGQGQMIGSGTMAARLVIIGETCRRDSGSSPTTLFGAAEDVLLWKMMAAIGLSPEDVYVTNRVKCCPLPGQAMAAEHGQGCLAYLRREIDLIGPRVICAMGEAAATTVLAGHEPVSRLRGRFHQYRYGREGGDPIEVMVTFHPRFLLECADMKKAAWLDLQMIQRRLQRR